MKYRSINVKQRSHISLVKEFIKFESILTMS